jgi:hypothetical protein
MITFARLLSRTVNSITNLSQNYPDNEEHKLSPTTKLHQFVKPVNMLVSHAASKHRYFWYLTEFMLNVRVTFPDVCLTDYL